MNQVASLFSYLARQLFVGAAIGGGGSFVVSATAAEFGLPVIAQVTFGIGLIAMVILLGLVAAALIGSAWQRLRG